MKNILVTGGAGFIGSHVADYLINNGYRVVIIDNLTSGRECNLNDKAIFYNHNILSDSIEEVFKKEKITHIFHFAAQISVVKSVQDPIYDAKINILGTLNLLKYSKQYNIEKFIAASSAAVYGDIPSPIKETDRPYPISQYGLSKLVMEKYIEMSGVNYLIFRFSNVYGPRQSADGEAGVVTIFSEAMKNNKEVTIYGDGKQIRDFIYVEDIAKIASKLGISDIHNQILNLSTSKGMSINELFECLKNQYNYKKSPIYAPKKSGDIDVSILDNGRLREKTQNLCFTDNFCTGSFYTAGDNNG